MKAIIEAAIEAKALFDRYAKEHNQKGNIEKRDTNINISDKLRLAIIEEIGYMPNKEVVDKAKQELISSGEV